MKINSNTIKLEKQSYEELENIIKKIASENKINNIKNVEVKLSKDSGVVKFAIDPYDYEDMDYTIPDGEKYYSDEEKQTLSKNQQKNLDHIFAVLEGIYDGKGRYVYYKGTPQEEEMKYASAFSTTRHYGGGEEGGWYYNRYKYISSVEIQGKEPEEAKSLIRDLFNSVADQAWGDIYSVRGGVDISILLEKEKGDAETKETPHYE